MNVTFGPGCPPLRGDLRVPGDKSLSHRAVLFAAMSEGKSQLDGVLDSADVRSTIDAVNRLGADARLSVGPGGALAGTVTGWGPEGPVSGERILVDCGNSGTTARLLMGALAGWPCEVELAGDESLSRRPMRRVAEPLAKMGAHMELTEGECLPATIYGSTKLLWAVHYDSPVASAQVKTAILLAGLRAFGRTSVREPAPSRDHTERLLPAFGVSIGRDEALNACWVDGPAELRATDVSVPGDPSSAAFMVAAAVLVPGSDVLVRDVALNPTRTGFLRVLERMGADVRITSSSSAGAEPLGTIHVRSGAYLASTVISADEVPTLVDEVPVLALVAGAAHGTTRFEGVGELRVKESDRLAAIVEGLKALGIAVWADEDTLEVTGPGKFRGAVLDSRGDHRLAMCWALAGLIAAEPVTVERFEAVSVSYPTFADDLARLGAPPS